MPTRQNSRHLLSFEIKSTSLPLVALHLKSTDLGRLSQDFAQRFGDMPEFFDEDGIMIDLSYLNKSSDSALRTPGLETPLDFSALQSLLRDYRLTASRCIMVEDTATNLRTAKQLGMRTVWISRDAAHHSYVDVRLTSALQLHRMRWVMNR